MRYITETELADIAPGDQVLLAMALPFGRRWAKWTTVTSGWQMRTSGLLRGLQIEVDGGYWIGASDIWDVRKGENAHENQNAS